MILTKTVKVKISNNAKYYSHLFDYKLKQGMILEIGIEDLPFNSNKIVEFSCDDCGDVNDRAIQLLNKADKHMCQPCARKYVGQKNIGNTNGFKGRDISGEKHPRWNPNKDIYSEYRSKVRMITESNDLSLLENHDKPRTLCGVDGAYQLDHIIPIKYGFDNNIDPEIIGNIKNLRFIPWKENRNKGMEINKERVSEILKEINNG